MLGRAVVRLKPRVVAQMVGESLGDGVDQLVTGVALVHAPHALVVGELDRVAVVGDALDDDLVADPRAHVRARVGVGVLGEGEQMVDAVVPHFEVAVAGAAQRVQVGERLALDRLGTVDVLEVGGTRRRPRLGRPRRRETPSS
jgi:hypothetical protein